MGSSIRMQSWLLLTALVAGAVAQYPGYNYVPPSRGSNIGEKRCPQPKVSYREVVKTVVRTTTVLVPQRTTVTEYRTSIEVKYQPSVVYRTVVESDYRPVNKERYVTVTNSNRQLVTENRQLPDVVRTETKVVQQPSVVYNDVVRTEVQQRVVTDTQLKTNVVTKTERVTYSQPADVIKTTYQVRQVPGPTVTRTEVVRSTVLKTEYLPAKTEYVTQLKTEVVTKTNTQFVPGATRYVTVTVPVPQQSVVVRTEYYPQVVKSTVLRTSPVIQTIYSTYVERVETPQVQYKTVQKQRVQQTVATVPVQATKLVEKVVKSVVTQPDTTRYVQKQVNVVNTEYVDQAPYTKVELRTKFEPQFVTVTVTSTDIQERVQTKLVQKDCGGYNYKQPQVQLSLF